MTGLATISVSNELFLSLRKTQIAFREDLGTYLLVSTLTESTCISLKVYDAMALKNLGWAIQMLIAGDETEEVRVF